MRAVVVHEYGGPEKLRFEDNVPEPQISGSTVLIAVQGEHLSVDGSLIEANAGRASRIPREQLAEAAQVKRTVREYLEELEQENSTYDHRPNCQTYQRRG